MQLRTYKITERVAVRQGKEGIRNKDDRTFLAFIAFIYIISGASLKRDKASLRAFSE